ncbi:porin family protein [Alphaproteobacteria bacterium]|nr:porin family protein [Alphaproteobacteria bacterium]
MLDTFEKHIKQHVERKHLVRQFFIDKKIAIARFIWGIFGSCDMRKTVYAAVVAAFIPCVASAEGFYVGALYGSTFMDAGVKSVAGASLDEDCTGYAFVIGNEIDENLSIEGFYIDFGEASLKGDSGDTFVFDGSTYVFVASAVIKATVTSVGVAGKLHFDMAEKVNGFVKFGMHNWDREVTLAVATASESKTDDGIDIVMGIGAEYDVSEKVACVVGYYTFILENDDVSFLAGGIKIRF